MTPFLVLVLAGFGLFVVVLGFVSTQDLISRTRVARSARKAAIRESEGVPRRASGAR